MASNENLFTILLETDYFESLDSLSNPAGILATDEQVTFVEPNLGRYFQFSKVTVTSGGSTAPEIYIRSCFLNYQY